MSTKKSIKDMFRFEKVTMAKIALRVLVISAGILCMAVGNILFLMPRDIVPGGFTGFAIIIYRIITHFNSDIKFFTPGIIALLLNIPLFVAAFKLKGKNFSLWTIFGTVLYSVLIDVFVLIDMDVEAITNNNEILQAVFGGVFMGVGYGFIIRNNGSTGGSDTLASIINAYKSGYSFGVVLLLIDGFVICLSGITFSWLGGGLEHGIPSALFAFLVVFLSSRIADFVIEGKNSTRAYYILSNNPAILSDFLMKRLGRGVTSIKAKGAFSNQEKEMLLCVVRRGQSAQLKKLIFEADPHAFVFASNAIEVLGEGFRAPEIKKKKGKKRETDIEQLAQQSWDFISENVIARQDAGLPPEVNIPEVIEETVKAVNIETLSTQPPEEIVEGLKPIIAEAIHRDKPD